MSIALVCPNGHKLRVKDEYAGKRVLCPRCRAVIPVSRENIQPPRPTEVRSAPEQPETLAQVPDDEQPQVPQADERREERGRRQSVRGAKARRHGLERVNLGLGFHYARLVLFLLTTVLLVGLSVGVALVPRSPIVRVLVVIGSLVTLGLFFLVPVLGLIGSILCLWVPKASKAKGLILASVALDVAAIPIGLVVQMRGLPSLLVAPMGLASWVLFMLFLRRLASYLKQQPVAAEALALLWWGLLLVVLPPVVLLLLSLVLRFLPWLSIIALPVGLIAWVVLAIKFLIRLLALIGTLRQLILSRS
jgi:hypothetical protein